MQINQHNYEEFFLMYADRELSALEMEMVNAFIQQNPDLKAELDLLLNTVSAGDENICFDDKEKLMAVNGFKEEELLTYLDGESDPAIAAAIEKAARENEDMRQRLALLEKLYFKPDTSVIYTGKDALYRRARITKMDWWKIAVAASLLLLISAWMFLYKEEADIEKPLAVVDTLKPEPLREIRPQVADRDTTPGKNVVIEPGHYVKISKEIESKKDEIPVAAPRSKVPAPGRPGKEAGEEVLTAQPKDVEKTVIPVGSAPANSITATAKEIPVQSTINETAMQTPPAVIEMPGREKKNSLLKKIGKKIGDRALDILSADGDDIHVAGFAINLKK